MVVGCIDACCVRNKYAGVIFSLYALLHLGMILVPSKQTHMEASNAADTNQKIYRLDHEYLQNGLVPSEKLESPVIEYYGLKGMLHDMKVELAASSYQCFHQMLNKDSKFYVFFEVLRGADKNIDFEIIRPDGICLKSFEWTNQGTHEGEVPIDGIYTFCLDNRLSRFSSKIIFLYMNSYYADDWEKLTDELTDMVTSITNFTISFQAIDNQVKRMLSLVSVDAQMLIKDWYLIKDNNSYVQRLSAFLCFLIVATSGLQVFFVRKLFAAPKMTPTSKPRA